jgi:hypothetical protein
VYKNCHIKRIKTLFKQAARHKKPWRCEEYIKKFNSIRPASYKFVRKVGIMQENLPMEQVSNRRTRNNRNRNNQPAAAEEVSAEEFHYEELTPEQVAAFASRKMCTTSRRGSQSVGNNDKQRFRITEQCVQDHQTTSGMCYRREHVAQMC